MRLIVQRSFVFTLFLFTYNMPAQDISLDNSTESYPPGYEEAVDHFYAGRHPESIEIIRSIFDDYRNSHELRLLAAANYLRMENYDNARAHMNYALQEHSRIPEIYGMYGRILKDEGRIGAAIRMLTNGVNRFPDHAALRIELAVIMVEQQRYNIARNHIDRLLESHPNHFQAVYLDGLLFLKEEKFDFAEFRFRHAEYLPGPANLRANLYNNLGWVLEQKARPLRDEGNFSQATEMVQEAANLYRKALEVDSGHEQARINQRRLNSQ